MTRAARRAAEVAALRRVLASDPAAGSLNVDRLAFRLYLRGVRAARPVPHR